MTHTHDDIEAVEERIAKLEAVMAKLPKTADGVPVVPGMILYGPNQFDEIQEHYTELEVNGDPLHCQVCGNCYSTRAAAEAAQAGVRS